MTYESVWRAAAGSAESGAPSYCPEETLHVYLSSACFHFPSRYSFMLLLCVVCCLYHLYFDSSCSPRLTFIVPPHSHPFSLLFLFISLLRHLSHFFLSFFFLSSFRSCASFIVSFRSYFLKENKIIKKLIEKLKIILKKKIHLIKKILIN